MRDKPREFVRVLIATVAGTGTALLFAGLIAYLQGWFNHWLTVPWQHLAMQVLTYELPITLFAGLAGVTVYRLIFRPVPDNQCRCRQCGYILKGLSKPECSECGEVI